MIFRVETLLSLSNNDIRTVSRLYLQTFGTSLEADLKDDTSGTFQKICVSLVQGNRNTSVVNLFIVGVGVIWVPEHLNSVFTLDNE